MDVLNYTGIILKELKMIQNNLSGPQLDSVASLLENKKRIFFSGMGRSGNMVKALAIRFMHLGYEAYVAGDASTPSIQEGDVLIAVSSSGKTKVTMNHIEVANKQKADVIMISSRKEAPENVSEYICIPAKTIVSSMQHAGSLFEQSVLIVGDAICLYLQNKISVTTETMNQRHANLQ